MILIDTPTSYPNLGVFSHMAGSTIEELHEFAKKVGVKRCWFSNTRGKKQPHYDVMKFKYELCIRAGAIPVKRKELKGFLNKTYGNANNVAR